MTTQLSLGRLVHQAHEFGFDVKIKTTLDNEYVGKVSEIGLDYFKVFCNNQNYKLKYDEVKYLEVMKWTRLKTH